MVGRGRAGFNKKLERGGGFRGGGAGGGKGAGGTLSFLSLVFLFTKENPQMKQGFLSPAEPAKTLEKPEKTHK